jgi:manganese-dependent inorganic pyrophosphatase
MLRAGANLAELSVAQLISRDSKEFAMGGADVEIAQVNAVDVDEVLSRYSELTSALQNVVDAKGLDLFLFVVTDILSSDSVGVAVGPHASAVESAFGVTLEGHRARLKGVVSRKLQIVPALTEEFSRR